MRATITKMSTAATDITSGTKIPVTTAILVPRIGGAEELNPKLLILAMALKSRPCYM